MPKDSGNASGATPRYNTRWWRGAGWALLLRCPRCGRDRAFRRFVLMNESCGECNLTFDRGHGYWLGAMMFNMACSLGAVVLVLVATVVATGPDPNWGLVVTATIVIAVLAPLIFFPFSRTLWMAAERAARLRDGAESE